MLIKKRSKPRVDKIQMKLLNESRREIKKLSKKIRPKEKLLKLLFHVFVIHNILTNFEE